MSVKKLEPQPIANKNKNTPTKMHTVVKRVTSKKKCGAQYFLK